MPIREANQSDLDRITELGSRSLKDGPYAGIIEDKPEVAREFATKVLTTGKILVAEAAGRVVGLLGFIVADHHFSGQRYAAELMWYVEPEHRKSSLGLDLFFAAEQAAKEMGAKSMVFTAPNEAIGAAYKRRGYSQLEVTYQKVF